MTDLDESTRQELKEQQIQKIEESASCEPKKKPRVYEKRERDRERKRESKRERERERGALTRHSRG